MPRILVVDDDPAIRELLRDYLAREGMAVSEAGDGPAAVESCRADPPDLVVLDIMLPGYDGMEACRRIRAFASVPILFLTARNDEVDQLLGFGFGGDDYVTKPFSPRTLIARIKALLRRTCAAENQAPRPFRFGCLEIDPDSYQVSLDGRPLALTVKEFQLLSYFASRPGRVLTKRQLVTGAWGEEYLGDDASLMVHLSHLRQKLGETGAWFKTVRGVGYKFLPGGEGGS